MRSTDTIADGSRVHTDTFADGSVIQTKVQIPGAAPKGATTQALGGCTRTESGASYFSKGCTASAGDGATSMQFAVDYSKPNTNVMGPYTSPQINRISGQGASNFGGNYTQQYFGIVKKFADTAGSAVARYQIKAEFFGAVASKQLNFTLTKAGVVSASIKQI